MFMQFFEAMEKEGWPEMVLLSPPDYFSLSCNIDAKYVFSDHITMMGVTVVPKFPEPRPKTLDLSEKNFTRPAMSTMGSSK